MLGITRERTEEDTEVVQIGTARQPKCNGKNWRLKQESVKDHRWTVRSWESSGLYRLERMCWSFGQKEDDRQEGRFLGAEAVQKE